MDKKTRYGLYYLIPLLCVILVIIIFFDPSINEGNIGSSAINKTDVIFWFGIILITLICTGISYLIMFKVKLLRTIEGFKVNYSNQDQKIAYEQLARNHNLDRIRGISNDLFFVIFIIGYFIFNLPSSSSIIDPNDVISVTFIFYQRYEVIALMSIPLLKLAHHFSIKKENSDNSFFQLGNRKDYSLFAIVSLFAFGILYIIVILIDSIVFGLASAEGREYLMLMLCATIPFEELVFRGVGYLVFAEIFSEIIYDVKKIERENRCNYPIYRKWGKFFSIFITSFLFGIYHIGAYGYSIYSISYLIALAFIMGITNYYLGLFIPYLIHSINNVIANIGASLSEDLAKILFSPVILFLIIIILCVIIYICYKSNFRSKKEDTND